MSLLLTVVGWIACCIYATIPSFWLLIHPHTNYWRERKRQRRAVYNILVPLWIAMWFVLAALTYLWRTLRLHENIYLWISGFALIFAGIYLYVQARHGFSPLQLSGHHELEPDRHRQRLVITGIRQRVRHPIYLGHLLEMLGWSIGTGLLVCFVLTAFAIITGAIMLRTEEKELVERFGDRYLEYQQRVPMIIPR